MRREVDTGERGLPQRIAAINMAWGCNALRPLPQTARSTDLALLRDAVPGEFSGQVVPKDIRYNYLASLAHALWAPIIEGNRPKLNRQGHETKAFIQAPRNVPVLPSYDHEKPTDCTIRTALKLVKGLNNLADRAVMEMHADSEFDEARARSDPFPEYVKDVKGGVEEGALLVGSAFAAIAEGMAAEKQEIPTAEEIATTMGNSRRVVNQLLTFHVFPQNVLDALVIERINPFRFISGPTPRIDVRDDILDFLWRVGEKVVSNPSLTEVEGDSALIFSSIIDAFPDGWIDPNDKEELGTAFTTLKETSTRSFADKQPSPFDIAKRITIINSLIGFGDEDMQDRSSPLSLAALLRISTAILLQVNDQREADNYRNTYGCPVRYVALFPSWYDYWSDMLVDWYRLETQNPASESGTL